MKPLHQAEIVEYEKDCYRQEGQDNTVKGLGQNDYWDGLYRGDTKDQAGS